MGRAASDVGFMFIAYNLRRIGNILTQQVLKEYLRILISLLSGVFGLLQALLSIPETRTNLSVIFSGENVRVPRK